MNFFNRYITAAVLAGTLLFPAPGSAAPDTATTVTTDTAVEATTDTAAEATTDTAAEAATDTTSEATQSAAAETAPSTTAAAAQPDLQPALTQAEETLSFAPLLVWEKNPEAVCYELELFTERPQKLQDDTADIHAAFHTNKIFSNAYNPLLKDILPKATGKTPLSVWWRVRALDLKLQPISNFSPLLRFTASPEKPEMNAPLPLSNGGQTPNTTLLYPVYSWLKQSNAAGFEVQLFDTLPASEAANDMPEPLATFKSEISEVYDTQPRFSEEPFYWRVRALQANNEPLGEWSKLAEFTVSPEHCATKIAAFGDSISHGGGHISFNPVDMEYSWLSYLPFPCMNLSQSGDITADLVARFSNDVLPFRPEYLLIMIGTNDLRSAEHSVEEAIANVETLREQCAAAEIKPIFLTLPPVNPDNISYAFQEKTDENWQAKFRLYNKYLTTLPHIDVASVFAPLADKSGNLPTALGLDGLHEDIPGKRLIAACVNLGLQQAMHEADKLAQE